MEDKISELPTDPHLLDNFLNERESQFNLKEGTRAQIIWNSQEPRQTEYAIVYLHGFRASHPEGDPVHKTIAKIFGYNLFLSRMEEHGIKSDYPLLNLTEEKMLRSARFALEIGRRIGKKVILMGTSTGGSLALYLASKTKYRKEISSLILYSPLISFYGISAKLLTSKLSRKILKIIPGEKHLITTTNTTFAEDRIWNKRYSLGGTLELGAFVEHNMTLPLFKKVSHPTFVGYYYKNKNEQDTVVSVPAIKKMIQNLGTRTELLHISNFPEANNHVICNSLVSKSVDNVIDNTNKFLKSVGSHMTSEI
ncbi:alpha/beta hydrolase [Fodinibius sp. AD559]|uniref:alpha/beta hydrolase n=1 Tax=Fodinibius sp. AD559 TaxID=3424179 RepID=UPI004046C200